MNVPSISRSTANTAALDEATSERYQASCSALPTGRARRLRARKPGVSRGRPGERRRPDPGGPVSCLGLVDLHLDAQVALHHFLEVVAGGLEHLEPAVLPVAHA